jgi:hypothetical protein
MQSRFGKLALYLAGVAMACTVVRLLIPNPG